MNSIGSFHAAGIAVRIAEQIGVRNDPHRRPPPIPPAHDLGPLRDGFGVVTEQIRIIPHGRSLQNERRHTERHRVALYSLHQRVELARLSRRAGFDPFRAADGQIVPLIRDAHHHQDHIDRRRLLGHQSNHIGTVGDVLLPHHAIPNLRRRQQRTAQHAAGDNPNFGITNVGESARDVLGGGVTHHQHAHRTRTVDDGDDGFIRGDRRGRAGPWDRGQHFDAGVGCRIDGRKERECESDGDHNRHDQRRTGG
ncbi:MAG: hypothetical protein RL726_2304 [Actinomycetota bacterium]